MNPTCTPETWITVSEAARLRGVNEHRFYSALKYGWIAGRQTEVHFGYGTRRSIGWRWEVKLADVMAMDFSPRPRRGARGPYSGPPSEKTLDELMAVIEEVRSKGDQHRAVPIFVQSKPKAADEQLETEREGVAT